MGVNPDFPDSLEVQDILKYIKNQQSPKFMGIKKIYLGTTIPKPEIKAFWGDSLKKKHSLE